MAPKQVKEFIEMSEKYHKLIDDKTEDIEKVLNDIRELKPNLCHFYDRNNKSLLMHAYESGEIKIIKLLVSLDIFMGYDEIFNDLIDSDKNKALVENIKTIRQIHRDHSKVLPNIHLLILKSKSKIANNKKNISSCYNLIEKAFEKINKNKTCEIVLKTAATWRKIKIYFDFKYDYVYYLDPTSEDKALGNAYANGIINIGAKSLADENRECEVLGVIIHELCHLAVQITYMNSFEPFPMGNSDMKIEYENKVMRECEKNKLRDTIIQSAFDAYKNEHVSCELIVRVPQMTMYYINNNEMLKQRREDYCSLFKYFEDFVQKMMAEATSILIQLQNDENDILLI